MNYSNFLDQIPESIGDELFENIVTTDHIKIERTISQGHTSPETGWYDQPQNEWVMVLQGKAVLQFEDDTEIELSANDYVNIPAHTRHKVKWTDPKQKTVWLAIHY